MFFPLFFIFFAESSSGGKTQGQQGSSWNESRTENMNTGLLSSFHIWFRRMLMLTQVSITHKRKQKSRNLI